VSGRTATRPQLGFLGAGWIGRRRMEAVVAAGLCDAVAVADPALEDGLDSLEELLDLDLDGIVIATPSALHAAQSIAALEAGLAVFCQKPLGRDAHEAAAVVAAARAADRLLGVDLTYRHSDAVRRCRELVAGGEIGDVYAVDARFHNAFGPDKEWFYDRALSGGGCVIDLGVHLVDLVRWTLGEPAVTGVAARVLHHGDRPVEDYAVATLDLATGAIATLACSWNIPAGRAAQFALTFYGTSGAVAVRNQGDSYTALRCELRRGTARESLVEHGEGWEGRALCAWAERLARGDRFDGAADELVANARVLDAIGGVPV
jgi:predicted dehydrogenase